MDDEDEKIISKVNLKHKLSDETVCDNTLIKDMLVERSDTVRTGCYRDTFTSRKCSPLRNMKTTNTAECRFNVDDDESCDDVIQRTNTRDNLRKTCSNKRKKLECEGKKSNVMLAKMLQNPITENLTNVKSGENIIRQRNENSQENLNERRNHVNAVGIFDSRNEEFSLSALQDAVHAVKRVPFADPDEVKYLLEENSGSSSERSYTSSKTSCPELGGSVEDGAKHTSTEDVADSIGVKQSDEDILHEQLMQDVKEIVKIFPNKDQYEIYAYLEAHIHKPNRIQIVVNELLGMFHSSRENSLRNSPVQDNPIYCQPGDDKTSVIDSLRFIFPKTDNSDLISILKSYDQHPEKIDSLVRDLMQISTYPKLRESIKVKLEKSLRETRASEKFLVTAFLELFDNPEEYFYDESKTVSDSYKQHAVTSLHNKFPSVSTNLIDSVLRNHRFHYTPALRQLEYEVSSLDDTNCKAKRMKINDNGEEGGKSLSEDVVDEQLSKEILFTELEEEILEYKREREELHVLKLDEARIKNELLTCGLCYDDDLLLEDTITCSEGHLFCKDCVRKEVDEKTIQDDDDGDLRCVHCGNAFALSTLQKILRPSSFCHLLKQSAHRKKRRSSSIAMTNTEQRRIEVGECIEAPDGIEPEQKS
ncbi:Uncharacterised protein g8393 [Pycnogonum litorale]